MDIDDTILEAQNLAYDGHTIEQIKFELGHVLKEEDKKHFHMLSIDFLAEYQHAAQDKHSALFKMILGIFILGLSILVSIISIWKANGVFVIALGGMIYGTYSSIMGFNSWNKPIRDFIPKSNLNFKKKSFDRYTS